MIPFIYSEELPVFSPDTLVVQLDGAKALTLRSFYNRIAKALSFSEYFGKNLDALYDCLTDLQGLAFEQRKVVLVIQSADLLLSKEKAEKKEAAIQVLIDAVVPENRLDERYFEVYYCRQHPAAS